MWLAPGAINLIGQLLTRPGAEPYTGGPLSLIDALVAHFLGQPIPGDSVIGYGVIPPEQTANYQTGPDSRIPYPAYAYTWEIAPQGTLYQVHPVYTMTWHAGGYRDSRFPFLGWNNVHTRGVLLTGFGIQGRPTKAQIATFARLAIETGKYLGRPLRVWGHKQLTPTTCPGNLMAVWLPEIEEIMRQLTAQEQSEATNALHVSWGIAQLLKALKSEYGQQLEDATVVLKRLLELN